MSIRIPAIGFFASLAALATAQTPVSGVQMQVTAVFPGIEPGGQPAPIAVEILSSGSEAEGVLTVTSTAGAMRVRVKVPPDRKRRIVTYPQCSAFSSIRFHLETDRGEATQMYGIGEPERRELHIVALIGDGRGQLSEFHKAHGSNTRVAYAKPEDAPDRPTGYAQIDALVLDKGAQRLNADQIGAIRSWVVEGGSLLLAEPSLAGTQPWKDLVVGSERWTFDGRVEERPFGLGRIVKVDQYPFATRVQKPAGLDGVFISTGDSGNLFASIALNSDHGDGPALEQTLTNPFSASLPPVSTVLGVLTAYFIAVVPLNFMLLRRLRRGEWAWATVPALSLAFAGVFFFAAKDLYAAKTSSSTAAVLFMQEGEPEAVALGRSQMFFPKKGTYDLALDRVDWMSQTWSLEEGLDPERISLRRLNWEGFEDRGEVEAERYRMPSLAFRDLFYRQRLDASGWIRIEDKGSTIVVENRSPYLLKGAGLIARGASFQVGDLESGASSSIDKSSLDLGGATRPYRLWERLRRSGATDSGVPVLTGTFVGLRLGPQVGTEVDGSAGVTLICTADERVVIGPPKGVPKPWLP